MYEGIIAIHVFVLSSSLKELVMFLTCIRQVTNWDLVGTHRLRVFVSTCTLIPVEDLKVGHYCLLSRPFFIRYRLRYYPIIQLCIFCITGNVIR
jgi:hypothetical protein